MEIIIKIFLLTFLLKFIDSIQIGIVKYASVITNTSLISTSNSKCLDCLCDCLNINSKFSKCYGINCFPSNHSCQRIEQAWIQETEILFNSTSDQFIQTIDLNFCSCYSSQNILNKYENVTPISIAHPMARYVAYNVYDDTLIVLGDNLIGQYFVSNLTQFRNWSVSSTPLAVFIGSINIFISFYNNASINVYDMHMNYIQSIARPITTTTYSGFYGFDRWNNLLFVTDKELNSIWSINLDTMNMSIYLNMTFYNITPFSITVFNNRLYISQISVSIIYIFDLISFAIQNITFPNSIPLYRLQKDPFCNRLWFGVNQINYSSVPVFDLDMNRAYMYQSKGLLATTTVYLATFDSNYSMYTAAINTNNFFKYQMSSITCGEN
jgi:hypothetical protein